MPLCISAEWHSCMLIVSYLSHHAIGQIDCHRITGIIGISIGFGREETATEVIWIIAAFRIINPARFRSAFQLYFYVRRILSNKLELFFPTISLIRRDFCILMSFHNSVSFHLLAELSLAFLVFHFLFAVKVILAFAEVVQTYFPLLYPLGNSIIKR